MKEKIVATLGLVLLSLMIIAMAAPVRAYTVDWAWVEPDFVGNDPYLGYIYGYVENTNWNFSFSWVNGGIIPMNVSDVRVYFDWGKNYTTSYSTINQIMPGMTQTFTVYNATPPITEAPELWRHHYDVYLDYVNNTVAPYQVIGSDHVASGSDFAVLSADHLACLQLWSKLSSVSWYSASSVSTAASTAIYSPTDITGVYILFAKAHMEYNLGLDIFNAGVFGDAKTHLTNADTLYSQALDTWDQRGTAIEDASLNNTIAQTGLYNAQADAARKSADAALVNSYGYLLFGLGWTFIGLGVIIYGMRKTKTAPPPT